MFKMDLGKTEEPEIKLSTSVGSSKKQESSKKTSTSALDFPGGSDSKVSAYNAGNPGSIPGSGRSPGEGNGNPLQYSCLEHPHRQRSLPGFSSWGCKESDMTERQSTLHIS